MVVINKAGFSVFPKDSKGIQYAVKYDGKEYTIPDELYTKYKELFHIVSKSEEVENTIEEIKIPKRKIQEIKIPERKIREIIKSENCKVQKRIVQKLKIPQPKVQEKKLKGIKIKKHIRDKLMKK